MKYIKLVLLALIEVVAQIYLERKEEEGKYE